MGANILIQLQCIWLRCNQHLRGLIFFIKFTFNYTDKTIYNISLITVFSKLLHINLFNQIIVNLFIFICSNNRVVISAIIIIYIENIKVIKKEQLFSFE